MSQISNEKQNEFNYYFCFLDKVDFGCAWLWRCLVWELSENYVMTKYKLSNKQKKLNVMREKPLRVKIIESNEQETFSKLLTCLVFRNKRITFVEEI